MLSLLLVVGCARRGAVSTTAAPPAAGGPGAPEWPVSSGRDVAGGQAAALTPSEATHAELLAQKASAHAQSLQQAMEARGQGGHDSRVNWLEPDAGRTPGADSAVRATDAAVPSDLSPVRVADASSRVHAATDAAAQVAQPSAVSQRAAPPHAAPAQAAPTQAAPVRPAAREETPGGGVEVLAAALGPIEQRIARAAMDYPGDLLAQLDYQILQMMRGEAVPQMRAIAGLSVEDRELIAALLDGLTNLRSSVRRDPRVLFERKIRPMLEVADRLRSTADLHLPVMVLCREIRGFGVYEPFASNRFAAGKANEMLVYVEVENFLPQLNERRLWETRLQVVATLYTDEGMVAWSEPDAGKAALVDVSRNRRRDFFLPKRIWLPATLAAGSYVLKVTVTDLQASKVAEQSLTLQLQ